MTNESHALLELTDISKVFRIRTGVLQRVTGEIRAVHSVNLTVKQNETLALVGESGCGKTTTARMVLKLARPTAGTIGFDDHDITQLPRKDIKSLRRQLQIVFQDPYSSLNPRMTVGDALGEPLNVHGIASGKRATELVNEVMEQVGLSPDYANRYPHQFSGGQRQRVGIARALITRPKLIVLDEPVSALDVSIRAGVINLLKDIREELKLSYLFIAHDLSVVRAIADRVAVMYLGKVVELGEREDVFTNPQHPYTQALLSAVPVADPNVEHQRQRIVLTGDVPSAASPPSGCPFRTRCWKVQDVCAELEPPLSSENPSHAVACHFPG